MLKLKMLLSAFIVLVANAAIVAQVKIGNNPTSINANSVLEIESTNKGFLMPRVALTSTIVTSPLLAHIAGMNVYNTATTGDVTPGNYYNDGTKWLRVANETNVPQYYSVEGTTDITTSSPIDVAIPGMSILPSKGTYAVMFNGQYSSTGGQISSFSTTQGCSDIELIYNQLISISATNIVHAAVFGNGETLTPGVYTFGGVINVQGTLTLDGGGDPNALFIIRAIGSAINTVAGVTIVLTNGATANNVFWIAGGAIGLGASTTMKGTLLAHDGAVAGGHFATIEGRMFAGVGAVTFDTGTASLPSPSTSSYVNYHSLSTFVMFACTGAVGNTGISTVTGDIGTNAGAITGFVSPTTLNGTSYAAGSSSASAINNALASFSIYQNGVLLANSTRTNSSNNAQMSLQGIATVSTASPGPIEIRWKIDMGPLTLGNRILTLMKVQ
jgi:Ice-binding-like